MDKNGFPNVKRDAFKIDSLLEQSSEKSYWLSLTPYERLEAVELMRKIIYGSESSGRLQRVFEIAQRKKS